jgi:hypothetical protein
LVQGVPGSLVGVISSVDQGEAQVVSRGSSRGRLSPELLGPPFRILTSLWAFFNGPRYDAAIADGINPATSIGLSTRASRITRRRACHRVAQALRGAVDAANQPSAPNPWDPRVPVDASAIQFCSDDVLALAETLATLHQPPARGVAIARQLAFDGRSPLFLQAAHYREGADRRLASTVDAAQRALEISADFG